MNTIKVIDETLHTASDWGRCYILNSSYNTPTSAVCKVRDKFDKLLCEATCVVEDNKIFVWIKKDVSQSIPRTVRKGRYDVFIVGEEYTLKIVMGDIEIIHDVSMH